jgi:hypothetical protein
MWVELKKWKLVFPDLISNKTEFGFNLSSEVWASPAHSRTKFHINKNWMESIAITKIYNLTAILRSCVPPFIQLPDVSIFKLRSPGFQGKKLHSERCSFSQVSHISSKLNFKKIRWLEIEKLQKQKCFQSFKLIRSDFTFFSVDEWINEWIIITVNRGGLESKYLYKGHWKSCDLFWVLHNIIQ